MKHIFITTLLAMGTLFSASATTNLTKEEAQVRKERIMQNSGNVVNEQRIGQPLRSSLAKAPQGILLRSISHLPIRMTILLNWQWP